MNKQKFMDEVVKYRKYHLIRDDGTERPITITELVTITGIILEDVLFQVSNSLIRAYKP